MIQIKIWLESKGEYREEYFLIIEGHQKKKKKETKRKHSDARYTPNQWEQQAKKILMQGYSSRSNTALKIKGKNRCKR